MPIKVIVKIEAKHGRRAELRDLLESIAATHAPRAPDFLGSTVYATLDSPAGLVEIADWESTAARAEAVQTALATGLYAPVVERAASPFPVTRFGWPSAHV